MLSEIDVIIHAWQIRKLCKLALFLQLVSNCLTFNLFLLNTKNTMVTTKDTYIPSLQTKVIISVSNYRRGK